MSKFSKFKVGDKVVVKQGAPYQYTKGGCYGVILEMGLHLFTGSYPLVEARIKWEGVSAETESLYGISIELLNDFHAQCFWIATHDLELYKPPTHEEIATAKKIELNNKIKEMSIKRKALGYKW